MSDLQGGAQLDDHFNNALEISVESLDLQAKWEALIKQANETEMEARETLAEGNGTKEELFVRRGTSMPNIGIILTDETGTTEYFLNCFISHQHVYEGGIIVAEPRMQRRGEGRGVSLPAHIAGTRALNLSENYDRAICQSLANVAGREVLHSIEVGYGKSDRKDSYLKRGYTPRPAYPQVVDMIFNPEK